jgi:hypothetical protein
MDKLSQRLEEYDFLRVAQEIDSYSSANANEISVMLSPTASLFGSFITVEVKIAGNKLPKPRSISDTFIKIVNVWLDWPPTSTSEHFGQRAISVTKLDALAENDPLETRITQNQSKTSISCKIPNKSLRDLRIRFATPSCYLLLPGRSPFERSLLNININLSVGSNYTIMYLEHPVDISLRSRVDNAEYHSLAYASEQGGIRKISFFKSNEVHVRYFWGANDTKKLTAPALPLYTGGASLIAAAFTLALVNSNLSDLASAVLAFALLPPALQLFSRQKIFFPSTDISRFSITDWFSLFSLMIYLPLIVLTSLSFVILPALRTTLEVVNLCTGLFLLLAGGMYIFLLDGGVFQHYSCDKCEKRIYWRKNTFLHLPTRRTLCRQCWQSQIAVDKAGKDSKL